MHINKMRLILLVILFSLAIGQKTDDPTESCIPLKINCICGTKSDAINRIVPVRQTMVITMRRYAHMSTTGQKKCYPMRHPSKICKRMSCELSHIQPGTIGGPVITSDHYPIEISIPKGGVHNDHRSARDSKTCRVKGLNHADIKCWRWPEFVDCMVNCSFGYALRSEKGSVLVKGMSCKYEEDRWWPHNFQDCEPYLNCKAHLVSAGFLKCKEPIDEPPYCEISCHDYEDKQRTKTKKYVCKDENFESTLPHCARLNKDEPILENPSLGKTTKQNTDYEYEEK